MKRCPTCQEEVAEQFSFCPVDGTPLSNGHHPSSVEAVAASAPAAREGAASFLMEGEPAVSNTTGQTYTANAVGADNMDAPNADASRADVTAGVPPVPVGHERGDFHLTFVSDEGLTRRLLKEVNEIGRASQLTW
ncbi:MAG: zinc ribbon domain-containing protein, partial [Acidobacteriota bacterium]|nr:zinc ribbon domain-containing protein [Acidobacteriota bacterium]